MNETKQRQIIAEACGWSGFSWLGDHGEILHKCATDPSGRSGENIPDYLNDLNAMHEAEKAVKDHGLYTYWISMIQESDHLNEHWNLATATAKQRAEAFLRTIGKWEEES